MATKLSIHLKQHVRSGMFCNAEQELYGVSEMDENLWKAYFRSNAEYITRSGRFSDCATDIIFFRE